MISTWLMQFLHKKGQDAATGRVGRLAAQVSKIRRIVQAKACGQPLPSKEALNRQKWQLEDIGKQLQEYTGSEDDEHPAQVIFLMGIVSFLLFFLLKELRYLGVCVAALKRATSSEDVLLPLTMRVEAECLLAELAANRCDYAEAASRLKEAIFLLQIGNDDEEPLDIGPLQLMLARCLIFRLVADLEMQPEDFPDVFDDETYGLAGAVATLRSAIETDPGFGLAYVELAACHEALRDRISAKEVAQAAISHAGLWQIPGQRPAHFVPGLKAQPWWTEADQDAIEVCDALSTSWSHLMDELQSVVEKPSSEWQVHPREWREVLLQGRKPRRPLLRARISQEASLRIEEICFAMGGNKTSNARSADDCDYAFGEFMAQSPLDELCRSAICPQTVGLLQGLSSVAEAIRLGIGRVWIASPPDPKWRRPKGPRCGPTNMRLTCVLGIRGRCMLRIADSDVRELSPGQVVVFDESFEWEFLRRPSDGGQVTPAALFVHCWHPDVDEENRQELAAQFQQVIMPAALFA